MPTKAIFIIPGFRQSPSSKAYRELAGIFEMEGYSPYPVKIPWRNNTISQNTEYFLEEYKKIRAGKKYILGFSYGAMIALLTATKTETAGLILCSLSPYFKEDISGSNFKIKSSLMETRYRDFLSLKAKTLSKMIKTDKVLLLYGSKEAKALIKRVKKTYDDLPTDNKYIFPIPKTEHALGDKKYLARLREVTKYL